MHRARNVYASRKRFEIDGKELLHTIDGVRIRRLGSRGDLPLPHPHRALPVADRHQLRRQLAGPGVGDRGARRRGARRALLPDRGRRRSARSSSRCADGPRGDRVPALPAPPSRGGALLPLLRDAARAPRTRRGGGQREPPPGAQGQPPLHRGPPGEGRPRRQPHPGRVPRRHAARGGDPLHAQLRPRDHGRVRARRRPPRRAGARIGGRGGPRGAGLQRPARSLRPASRAEPPPSRRGPAGRRRW